jgi:chromosome segregation ATPase
MPRKSQAEMIADLERKLEEAKAKAQDKVKTDIEKLHARRELLVQREAKIAADILKIDEEIAALVTPTVEAPAAKPVTTTKDKAVKAESDVDAVA